MNRIIVAGSRSYGQQRKDEALDDYTRRLEANRVIVFKTLTGLYINSTPPLTILSGLAIGPDRWGKRWAETMEEYGVGLETYPPDYKTYGRKFAPLRRNEEMVRNADTLIAFYDGISGGTGHVIRVAREMGLKIYEHVNILL